MVTAKFEPVDHTYELSVTLDGKGYGSVSSTPAGVECSNGTCSADFLSGSTVTLTPVAESGNSFAGWEGACSGMSNCELTMSAVKSVIATFRSNISPALQGPTLFDWLFRQSLVCRE